MNIYVKLCTDSKLVHSRVISYKTLRHRTVLSANFAQLEFSFTSGGTALSRTLSQKYLTLTPNNGHSHSRSFKVTNVGTSGNTVRDFLCVSNSNLPPIMCCSRDTPGFWSNFLCLQGVPLFNELVWGEPLNAGLQNLASETRDISLSYGVKSNSMS